MRFYLNAAIAFDISALSLFSIVVLLFLNKRIAPTQTSRVFLLFVLTLFFTNLFSLFSLLQEEHIIFSAAVHETTKTIHHVLEATIPLLFTFYIFTLVSSQKHISQHFLTYFFIPFALYIAVGFSSARLTSSFLIQKITFSIYTIYFFIRSMIFLQKHRALFPRKRITTLCTFLVCLTLILNAQNLLPYFPIENLLYALSIFVLLFTTHRQEETICSISSLYNQSAFYAMYAKYFDKQNPFTIVTIVLDDLFYLLKMLGIPQINTIIKETATFLSQTAKDALVFHFNDGKFCATFNDSNEEKYLDFIDKVKMRFLKPWNIDLIETKLFPRLGLIFCPKDAKSVEDIIEILEILQHDDTYKTDDLVLASQIDTSYRIKNAYLDRSVKNALAENRIDIYYQPIYSTEKKRIIGAEALVRMQDENGIDISPEDFIPIAEKNGTILRIGEFAYESVCRFISEIDPEKFGIEKMDINLSVVQCMQKDLSEQFLLIADIYKVPYSFLNFEITETAAIFSKTILEKNIKHFSESGVELSLDDYGSGYSNINYLINLPFNVIKIDKGIIWDAFVNDKSYTALAFSISMIKALGMRVLAEGVETYEQADRLTKLGCDYLQGFYYSKAVPRDFFLSLLVERQAENKIKDTIVDTDAKIKTKQIIHDSRKELESIHQKTSRSKVTDHKLKTDIQTTIEKIEEIEELEGIEDLAEINTL